MTGWSREIEVLNDEDGQYARVWGQVDRAEATFERALTTTLVLLWLCGAGSRCKTVGLTWGWERVQEPHRLSLSVFDLCVQVSQ